MNELKQNRYYNNGLPKQIKRLREVKTLLFEVEGNLRLRRKTHRKLQSASRENYRKFQNSKRSFDG